MRCGNAITKGLAEIVEAVHTYASIAKIPAQSASSNGDTPGTQWFFNTVRGLEGACIVSCSSVTQLQNELNFELYNAMPRFQATLTPSFVVTKRCKTS